MRREEEEDVVGFVTRLHIFLFIALDKSVICGLPCFFYSSPFQHPWHWVVFFLASYFFEVSVVGFGILGVVQFGDATRNYSAVMD